ncbi:MAG: hypothetical protein BWZ03_00871 [bacterium ADurb.BinA186]|nr:MAG: hypothetical protein BWZ03_00871 [bacterium ADurb.BinA186]
MTLDFLIGKDQVLIDVADCRFNWLKFKKKSAAANERFEVAPIIWRNKGKNLFDQLSLAPDPFNKWFGGNLLSRFHKRKHLTPKGS